jgi:hypothetical protein
MEIRRSLGVSRLVALMAAHRGSSAHDRLLASLDQLVAEARDLCARACPRAGDPDAVAHAFQTALARPTRDWMHRAERKVRTVRPSRDTLCGARAYELRQLVDCANVAMMKQYDGREAWNAFYHSAQETQTR